MFDNEVVFFGYEVDETLMYDGNEWWGLTHHQVFIILIIFFLCK